MLPKTGVYLTRRICIVSVLPVATSRRYPSSDSWDECHISAATGSMSMQLPNMCMEGLISASSRPLHRRQHQRPPRRIADGGNPFLADSVSDARISIAIRHCTEYGVNTARESYRPAQAP